MVEAIDHADFVVEDLTSPAAIIEFDPDVHAHMTSMHEVGPFGYFRVWKRETPENLSVHLK
jgi:hypothetical protein